MKKLLLSCLLIAVGSSASAQTTCATAINITANGTITTPAYASSTFSGTCMATRTGIRAIWYKYTPTVNGEMTISSNFTGNTNNGTTYTDDTRVSVLKGTCAALTCVDSNDDVGATNYLSTVVVPVAAGTTYYIQWDNYWYAGVANQQQKALQFSFSFNPVSCIRPGAADFYRPEGYTTTGASLFWNNAIGTPGNYDIDWSTNLTAAAGSGTIVPVTSGTLTYTQGDITGLPANANFRYYVRSNCGGTQSGWQGPYFGYLAVGLPYANSFEDADLNYTDGFIGFSRITTSPTSNPPSYNAGDDPDGVSMYTFNSTTAASNLWAYSRAITLAAGDQVNVNFKTRLYSTAEASPMSLDLTVGDEQSAAAQINVIGTATADSADAYQDQAFSWTAPEAGIYYFGFHNNSAVGTAQTFMFFDDLDITSVLSNSDFLSSNLTVYPNPANNVLNISNSVNATINNVDVTDLNGRVIKSVKVNATEGQISVSDLAAGMYMVKITTDQGTGVKKIVKQ